MLASRFGVAAMEALIAGNYGTMTALRGEKVQLVGLGEALSSSKPLDMSIYDVATVFFN